MAAEVAAENNQNSLLTDYNLINELQEGDRQDASINRLGKTRELNGCCSKLANSIAYTHW
jgi:hypothetical protein